MTRAHPRQSSPQVGQTRRTWRFYGDRVDATQRQLSDQIDDATQRLLGQERPAYASAEARDADIAFGAGLTAKELRTDLARSALAFRTIVKQMPDDAWQFQVRILDSAPFPAAPCRHARPSPCSR